MRRRVTLASSGSPLKTKDDSRRVIYFIMLAFGIVMPMVRISIVVVVKASYS
ncbi:hypothetical protein ACERJO_08915 [Halalkalibacter sp. AB-rgal2]|uniref:hypothetical protein n=1 Tax=Halalkalibacter sp. AB-rgal2 TaxID=3242695 RepID=UPI00359D1934